MIEIRQFRRQNDHKDYVSLGNMELNDVAAAMRFLVEFELMFGGRVVSATETKLEVETEILSKVDRTIFTGPKDKMRELLLVVLAWSELKGQISMHDLWERVKNLTKGRVLEVVHGAPLIQGQMILEELAKKHGICTEK